jgi:hypothetical protein
MPYKDKLKQKEYQNKYFKKNLVKYRENNRLKRNEIAQRLYDYKATLKCLCCGKSGPVCIDFHHNGDSAKSGTVSNIVRQTRCWEKILEEINKCIPVCVNCHRKIHKTDNQKYLIDCDGSQQNKREIIRWYINYKSGLVCDICGEDEPCCLDFHHKENKTIKVGLCAGKGWSKNRILKEIEKCEVLCGNCHREFRTFSNKAS